MKLPFYFVALSAALALTACHKQASSQSEIRLYEQDQFKKRWYAGKAEVASYTLDQARYGENHTGSAVLIFVTEPFSKDRQVKLDDPEAAGKDNVTVMKLNFTKKFITGIYPYSMMLSVFTPVNRHEFPYTLKTTMTSQEWCGHVFTQMNLNGGKYDVHSYSYFESEGDEKTILPRALLEDEIWNIIRLNPERLPIGEVDIIPGLFFTRLQHQTLAREKARASHEVTGDTVRYTLQYASKRSFTISYDKNFPHTILGWREEFPDRNGKIMVTTAQLDKTLFVDYWTKNKREFQHLRDSLGLPSPR